MLPSRCAVLFCFLFSSAITLIALSAAFNNFWMLLVAGVLAGCLSTSMWFAFEGDKWPL